MLIGRHVFATPIHLCDTEIYEAPFEIEIEIDAATTFAAVFIFHNKKVPMTLLSFPLATFIQNKKPTTMMMMMMMTIHRTFYYNQVYCPYTLY